MSNKNTWSARANKLFATFGLFASLGFTACHADKTSTADQNNFPIISPILLDTVYTKEYVADIQSVQNVELRARVKGFIEKIYVDEGKPVIAGQVLFSLSSQEFKEDLLRANATLKSALADLKVTEVELKNARSLVEKNIVSKTQLEMAEAKSEAIQAKIEEAQSAIAVAKLNLSFTQVKAPFTGIINRIPNKVGSLVEEGTLLTTISDNKAVFAYFNVSEKEYLDFVKNNDRETKTRVTLRLANDEPFDQTGAIETVESEINKNTGNIAFRARFANPAHILKHGSSAKILVSNTLKNALIIPQKSTFEVQDKLNVYVVDENNTVNVKSIVTKLRLPNLYVVASGLSPSDRIVYEGVQLVKDGDKITPQPVQSNEVLRQLAMK